MRVPLSSEERERSIREIQSLTWGFDVLPHHVIITDRDANILYANPAVEKHTGFSPQESIGHNPGDLWGGKMPKAFYEAMWRTIKDEKKPFVGETRNIRKNGQAYWQELLISPVLDSTGDVHFFVAIEPDITDRKQRERFREEFIAMIGHQLRGPLGAFRWAFELLMGEPLSEKQRALLETMQTQNKSLLDLVTDLLFLARIEEGSGTREKGDLAEIVQRLLTTLKTHHPRVLFSLRKDADTFPLMIHRTLAEQIFANILTNAAEYSDPQGGKVDITLQRTREGYLWTCTDNGVGIPAEDQPRIFERLFRASNAKRRKPVGTGLGLYLTKMIADRLGWGLHFQSPAKDGKGTIFTVRIPLPFSQ